MATIVQMPRLGLTMTSGLLVKWLVEVGDKIEKGSPIAEIESDKSTVTYEAPDSGYVLELLLEEGKSCDILQPIAVIGNQGEKIPDNLYSNKANSEEVPEKTHNSRDVDMQVEAEKDVETSRIFISPIARKLAEKNNIDIREVPFPAGKKRIEKAHILEYLEINKRKATPLASKMAAEMGIDLKSIEKKAGERIFSTDLSLPVASPTREDVIIPVEGMRRVISQRMKQSIQEAAHVMLTTEVDMSNAMDLKDRIAHKVEDRFDVKISLNDIIVKCVAKALRENPRMNCVFTENEIIQKGDIHIGVAVALEEGLIVPVVRNTDLLSIPQIAIESKRLVNKARRGELLPDEYSEGTFTVSNLGMYEITEFTSIINQPESAILSVGKVVEKVVPLNGEIVIRPRMKMTINFDHRPIDGSTAAIFLKRLKEILEEPYELLV